jgi:SAM-dependent methyltransferase
MNSFERRACRSCGASLEHTFVDLGVMPPANSYVTDLKAVDSERSYPLCTKVCHACFLVQVDFDVAPDELFADYAYFSSFSTSWLEHARIFCESAVEKFALTQDSFVVELASNDGYLLKNFVSKGIPVLGVDPSETVAEAARAQGVPTEILFFGKSVAKTLTETRPKADLIIGNNVLAHVPDTNDFVAGVAVLLNDGGSISIEFPHLLNLIRKVEFDTIYHEHYSYLSLLAVEALFARHHLRIYDIEELPTHGGSLRISGCSSADPRPENPSVGRIRDAEASAGLHRIETYARFGEAVNTCKESFKDFLASARAAGKTVVGYGAAAKGNTLLNYAGAGPDDLMFIADRNPHKQGKWTPGSHIPIVDPKNITEMRPDYVVIFPWNLEKEIRAQLSEVVSWGGRFVIPIPATRVC